MALVNGHIEVCKWVALVLCGAALVISWRATGIVVQGFFLGNVLPMMGVVGSLYQETPLRVCNAYRMDEQQGVGLILVWLALAIAVAWSPCVGWILNRREASCCNYWELRNRRTRTSTLIGRVDVGDASRSRDGGEYWPGSEAQLGRKR